MRLPHHPFVKICCISTVEEARVAIACGASALGLVSSMPSGPGVIALDLIAEIAATVPPPVATFLLTSAQDAEAILEQHRACGTTTLQLVDEVTTDDLRKLRLLDSGNPNLGSSRRSLHARPLREAGSARLEADLGK
jgi:phosphoribosylanthranilate isomerase